ncbi:MAG: hypothetical protein PVG35_09060 [Desulfobacterales bacterium]|jgi:hypothetical protein
MGCLTPFDRYSNAARKRALIIALVLSLVLLVALRILDVPLRTAVAPRGIVSFELAKDASASRQIRASWNARAKTHAAFSLGLDYLFLIVYAVFISLACVQTGEAIQHISPLLARVGGILAWAQFAAAVLDAVENLVLISLLLDSERSWLPAVARGCAIIKFAIVSAGFIYIGGGLLVIAIQTFLKEK